MKENSGKKIPQNNFSYGMDLEISQNQKKNFRQCVLPTLPGQQSNRKGKE